MSDSQNLIDGLQEHQRTLAELNTQTDQVFTQLEKHWQALRSAYDVEASALKIGWLQTVSRFLEYQNGLDRLEEAAGHRIGALKQSGS